MYKRVLFLFLINSSCFFGQSKMTVASLFDKIDKQYKKNYSYTADYFLYKTESSKVIVDQYSGISIQKEGINYQKKNKLEYINFSDYFVSINHLEKKILISKSRKNDPESLNALLKLYGNSKLNQDTRYWICELFTENIDKSNPSQRLLIYINKNDFSLHKQLFYFIGSQEVVNKSKKITIKNPRLEILFKKSSENTVQNNSLLSKETYFTIKNKKINLSKRFKAYKLITL